MKTIESEKIVLEIEKLIKTYIFCNSIIAILKQQIESETKNQCLLELRKKGFEITEPSKGEIKKMRSELKQIKTRVLELKTQLTSIQIEVYKSRLAWTS